MARGPGVQGLGHVAPSSCDVLREERGTELKQPIGRVDQHREDVLAVGDGQVDAWVAGGVGDEQERCDLVLIGKDETVGEFEDVRAGHLNALEIHDGEHTSAGFVAG